MQVFKIRQVHHRRDSSDVRWKKLGKIWSTNYGDLRVESYLPKLTFSGDHILTPGWCCAPKFSCALEWPSLASTPPPEMVSPIQFFFKLGVKNWLKIQRMIFLARGSRIVKLFHVTTLAWGDNVGTTFGGASPP